MLELPIKVSRTRLDRLRSGPFLHAFGGPIAYYLPCLLYQIIPYMPACLPGVSILMLPFTTHRTNDAGYVLASHELSGRPFEPQSAHGHRRHQGSFFWVSGASPAKIHCRPRQARTETRKALRTACCSRLLVHTHHGFSLFAPRRQHLHEHQRQQESRNAGSFGSGPLRGCNCHLDLIWWAATEFDWPLLGTSSVPGSY